MTIDEALIEIKKSPHCWIAWREDTGEILSVTNFAERTTPQEMMQCLQSLKALGLSVEGRFLESSTVTRETLVKDAAQSAVARSRIEILTEWSKAPVGNLITFLERGEYASPMGPRDGRVIVEHLWELHRDEVTSEIRDRLRYWIGTANLHPGTTDRLIVFLAALDYDEARLKAIWTGALPGRNCWAMTIYLMEAFAYVRSSDKEVIDDFIAVFDMETPFQCKFETMLNLGRMGQIAAAATDIIRARVYDSELYITAARDRVLERLTTSDREWERCPHCCYGRVHGDRLFGVGSCRECVGTGYVRVSGKG